jgi:Xaa-Pro aminopeptidase
MRSGRPGVLELNEWVLENMTKGQTIGIDPMLIPNGQAVAMQKLFATKGINLVAVERNPVDAVWIKCGKPTLPSNPLRPLDITKTGKSHQEKLESIQKFISDNNAIAFLAPALDDVAWLLNVRGADVEYNPVALAYAVVTLEQTVLFVDLNKVTAEVREHLGSRVTVRPYEDVKEFLVAESKKGKIIMDPAQVSWSLYSCVGEAVLPKVSPIVLAKSLKNPVELEGFRQAHIRDGAALTAFFCWLENHVKGGGTITEHGATLRVEEFRARMKDHMGPSFGTIAGYGPNGAIIHYSPDKDNSPVIGTDSTFLFDSGAQYLDGTTDVTRWATGTVHPSYTFCNKVSFVWHRTMHFGTPTDRMKQTYTAVLKVSFIYCPHPQHLDHTVTSFPYWIPCRATSRWPRWWSLRARWARVSTAWPAWRCGSWAWTTITARATAWAPSSTCTRGRRASASERETMKWCVDGVVVL